MAKETMTPQTMDPDTEEQKISSETPETKSESTAASAQTGLSEEVHSKQDDKPASPAQTTAMSGFLNHVRNRSQVLESLSADGRTPAQDRNPENEEKLENEETTQPEDGIFSGLLASSAIQSFQEADLEFENTFDAASAVAAAKEAALHEPVHKPVGRRSARRNGIGSDPARKAEFYSSSSSHPERKPRRSPKTYSEVLQTDFLESDDDQEEAAGILQASAIVESGRLKEEERKKRQAEEEARAAAAAQEESAEEYEEEDEDNIIIDPDASLVDDYHYDEYEDKKRFLLSDYRKIEDYLEAQSQQGFHYTRHEGKKYYFYKGRPHNYYYRILYFSKEPDAAQWQKWEDEGWQNISQQESRHKKDAGWYVLRNEKEAGELKADIDNEEEKYRYFRKFSSSCRSTMFLLFVVMACCAVTAWLQYEFKGFLAVIILSIVLFVIALYIFLVYARMLAKSKKQADLLAARIRLKENDPEWQKLHNPDRTDAQLEKEWDTLDEKDNTV